ncbi:alkaline phosphatase [Bacillus atrophaeus]|nr:alkaline phosphatase [Bacillus atrophaeus]MCY7948124.1 alkaline phosphatase [Bacillus atrophaeus]MCY8095128.1 alkaline phosphatase [Bacillus atrophaeus]MCY9166877.1 alkaline phosphatase [Bacillus atrophaeus]MEC0740809.1 alkaline phosphatase [Bacillus atrophaeus]MEC0746864.1 alkaline phosphatase [Bacillus atrophaeus]
MRTMKFFQNVKAKLLPLAAVSVLTAGIFTGIEFQQAEKADAKKQDKNEIRNVIVMIGDGMGTPYINAYRSLKNNGKTPNDMKLTEFDPNLTGMMMTYPGDPDYNITDSAAAGTALSTGVKTYNNAIGVNKNKKRVKSVLEEAKEQGKSTGLVATSEINHATPAAYGAHNESRKNMNQIANSYFDDKINGKQKIDVLLGGGKTYFNRKDRNLTEEFKKTGYSYVTTKRELKKDKNKQILGLFADGGLAKALDRDSQTPSLEDMTSSAIDRLNQNKKGFFLMVEGSQIDWAAHDNDVVGAMSEVKDFEKAYKAAIQFAKKDKHTLVIATADHTTGGFTIGANSEKNWHAKPILAAKRTPEFMAKKIAEGKPAKDVLSRYTDLTFTAEEIKTVEAAAQADQNKGAYKAIIKLFNTRSNSGWTSTDHTGEEVPVYAYGPGKEKFAGLINNTDQAKKIFKILKTGK